MAAKRKNKTLLQRSQHRHQGEFMMAITMMWTESLWVSSTVVIKHQWHSDHSTLLNSLNWQPLQTCRRLIKLNICYNILNIYSCIPHQFSPLTPILIYDILIARCFLDLMLKPIPIYIFFIELYTAGTTYPLT